MLDNASFHDHTKSSVANLSGPVFPSSESLEGDVFDSENDVDTMDLETLEEKPVEPIGGGTWLKVATRDRMALKYEYEGNSQIRYRSDWQSVGDGPGKRDRHVQLCCLGPENAALNIAMVFSKGQCALTITGSDQQGNSIEQSNRDIKLEGTYAVAQPRHWLQCRQEATELLISAKQREFSSKGSYKLIWLGKKAEVRQLLLIERASAVALREMAKDEKVESKINE
ncbi:hypothetical protein QFC20_007436 [Naganishia adeliensis]|uniref:Uncharacterized protein n=1 Tax=Naganishia adeliensis TaxID=92952 RepID=A0ACC2V0H3_9TREE|nr:hypothetical protein QFC20_007436 [Naganishia adeliensis]